MAHKIEGNKCFFTGKPAWHKLGIVLKNAPTPQEAWKLAYPHNIFEFPIAGVIEHEGTTEYLPIDSKKLILRDDGKILGVMGKDYSISQPYTSFSFFEPFLATGECTLEAGGSLNDGARMWALAKLHNSAADVVKNDTVESYLLAATSFDGSLSHCIGLTNTRVVCNNTLSLALGSNFNGMRAKHTRSLPDKIEQAKIQIASARESFKKSLEAYQAAAAKKATQKEMIAYIHNVFDFDPADEDNSTRSENIVNNVIDLLDSQTGLDLVPAIRGTKWQAYNAVTQYITHEYGRNEDSRLNAQWFGTTKTLNQKALELAIQ